MNNVVNEVAYLRTSREFPEEIHQLCVECNKSYLDVANAVNSRIIGIFPNNRPAITGEAWYITGQKQQTLRQIYPFTSIGDINIGFKISSINQFSRCRGQYTDGTSWYGVIFSTSNAIAGQLSFFVTVNGASTTSDLIRFVNGGAPVVSKGIIILEWLSNI